MSCMYQLIIIHLRYCTIFWKEELVKPHICVGSPLAINYAHHCSHKMYNYQFSVVSTLLFSLNIIALITIISTYINLHVEVYAPIIIEGNDRFERLKKFIYPLHEIY